MFMSGFSMDRQYAARSSLSGDDRRDPAVVGDRDGPPWAQVEGEGVRSVERVEYLFGLIARPQHLPGDIGDPVGIQGMAGE